MVRKKNKGFVELNELKEGIRVPLIFIGDFNEILKLEERKGCNSVLGSNDDFRAWINDMGLIDLPLVGRKYTWFKGNSCSWIDKVLIKLWDLQRGMSNHYSLLLEK